MRYEEIKEEYEILAELDYSISYDTEHYLLVRKDNEYYIAAGIGCSCWDGHYDINQIVTLSDLHTYVLGYLKDEQELEERQGFLDKCKEIMSGKRDRQLDRGLS